MSDPEGDALSAPRHGFQLLEILVALAVVAGPAIVAFQLVQANTRAARFDAERANAVLLMGDVLDLLASEDPAPLKALGGPAGAPALRALALQRITANPASPDDGMRVQSCELTRGLRAVVETDVGQNPGLTRVTVVVTLKRGDELQLRRYLRFARAPFSAPRAAGAAAPVK